MREPGRNSEMKVSRTVNGLKNLLNIAANAANEVIKSGTFSLFKPSELGDWAYKYLFILEDEKSNPAGLMKSSNNEYIFSRRHDPVVSTIGFNLTEGRLGNAVYVTRKMANMYLTSEGLPIDPKTHDYSMMNSEFQKRDNRMKNTLMEPGEYFWSPGGGRVDWKGGETDKRNAVFKNFKPQKGTGYFHRNGVANATVCLPEMNRMTIRLSVMRRCC